MSREREHQEGIRWLRQAEDDLGAARVLRNHAKYAQACFLCQQAGKKALKALWYSRGSDPWGHSVLRLIEDLEDADLRNELMDLVDEARALDRLYVPTRYPNGLPDLVPLEAFGMKDVEEALQAASRIIDRIKVLRGWQLPG